MGKNSPEALQGESSILKLLRDIFWTEAPQDLLQQLSLVEPVTIENDLDRALNDLLSEVKHNQSRLEKYTEELEVEFARLFIGPQQPPAVPYASFYLSDTKTLMTEATIEVRKRYLDSVMAVKDLFSTPEDHVAIELEYLMHQTERALVAAQGGELGEMESTLNQRDKFIEIHMAPWIHQFTQRIHEATTESFYRAAADLLDAYIKLVPARNVEKEAIAD